MKAIYDRESNDIFLKIDTDKKYKDDYKTHMISENNICGVIPYHVRETKEGSSYNYNVSGMISMKNKFLDRCVSKEDMILFLRSLFDTVNDIKKYMLSADDILFYPELIFWDKDKWRFCYFPFKGKGFEYGFFRIKDFLVKRISNDDVEGIIFFHKVHKASLITPFTMDNIMRVIEEASQMNIDDKKDDVYGNIYDIENEDLKMVCENPDDKSILGHYRKNRKSREIKKMWGNW